MVDTLDVHALGPSGSGKTVFLASLYSLLRIRRADFAFYLRTELSASLDLNAVYNRVTSPEETWPEASQSVHEWTFTVTVPSESGDLEPLQIRYLDYPGGILTNPHASNDERIGRLLGRLREANGLLVLLDGMAMRDLVHGRPSGQRYLDVELSSSLEIAQQSRCPIHFVVTKWDLLDGTVALGQVRDRLLSDDNFGDLVQAKSRDVGSTIRLIPVSSVGSGFARLLSDGRMEKTGAKARPFNVQTPLVAVLPDFMQYAYEGLALQEAALDQQPQATSKVDALIGAPGASEKVGDYVAKLLQRYAPTLGARVLQRNPVLAGLIASKPDVIAQTVSGLAQRLIRAREERGRAGREAYLTDLHRKRLAVRTEREAYELVEAQFASLLSEFETAYPESVLSGGTRVFLDELEGVAR